MKIILFAFRSNSFRTPLIFSSENQPATSSSRIHLENLSPLSYSLFFSKAPRFQQLTSTSLSLIRSSSPKKTKTKAPLSSPEKSLCPLL